MVGGRHTKLSLCYSENTKTEFVLISKLENLWLKTNERLAVLAVKMKDPNQVFEHTGARALATQSKQHVASTGGCCDGGELQGPTRTVCLR